MESRGESVWTKIEHIFEHLGCVRKTQWKREGKAHRIWTKNAANGIESMST